MGAVYRSNPAWALFGFAVGAGITFAAFIMFLRAVVITEQRSPYDFATTLQIITTSAVDRGWNVSPVAGLPAALAQAEGLKNGRVEVLEMCHPQYGAEILKYGKPHCLAMMPCSLAVYERDGQVYVASLNRGLIGRFFRRETASVIRKVRADEREILHMVAAR